MHLHSYSQTTHSALVQTFCPSNSILRVNGKLQFGKNLINQCAKMSQNESSCFLTKTFSKSVKVLSNGTRSFYPSLTDVVEAMKTLIQKKNNDCENCITAKMSRKRKNWRFTLQMENMVLHSLLRTWDILPKTMLVSILDWCLEEKDIINPNLQMTLSAYTLSWYTRTRLSTDSLPTGRLHCCVALFLFHSSRQETL